MGGSYTIAGIGGTLNGFELSVDGIETIVATNHLGHFKMYKDLCKVIESTAEKYGVAILVHVSSAAQFSASADYEGIPATVEELNNVTSKSFTMEVFPRYGTSKLMNILFSNEIAERMTTKKINVLSNSIHPGLVSTNLAAGFEELITSLHPILSVPLLKVYDTLRSGRYFFF